MNSGASESSCSCQDFALSASFAIERGITRRAEALSQKKSPRMGVVEISGTEIARQGSRA